MKNTSPNKMKLGDFIAQTLMEIIDGVTTAQAYAKDKKASINPKHINWSSEKQRHYIIADNVGDPDNAPLINPIDFEILLTIAEDDKAQGTLGVFAAALGAGIRGETIEHSETANKIKFQILTKLPQQE